MSTHTWKSLQYTNPFFTLSPNSLPLGFLLLYKASHPCSQFSTCFGACVPCGCLPKDHFPLSLTCLLLVSLAAAVLGRRICVCPTCLPLPSNRGILIVSCLSLPFFPFVSSLSAAAALGRRIFFLFHLSSLPWLCWALLLPASLFVCFGSTLVYLLGDIGLIMVLSCVDMRRNLRL